VGSPPILQEKIGKSGFMYYNDTGIFPQKELGIHSIGITIRQTSFLFENMTVFFLKTHREPLKNVFFIGPFIVTRAVY